MGFYLKGVHLPHRKNTAEISAVRMGIPHTVTIPTAMHIGAPAEVVVKKGDKVCVGTLIAKAAGGISSPIHSSVSGTVAEIREALISNGKKVPCVVINSDSENKIDDSIKAPTITTKEELIEAVKQSGAVGLGGAGFPTYAKLPLNREIDYLVINGAECEPYITSDSISMVDRQEDIFTGLSKLLELLPINKVVIGIEENKPAAIRSMEELSLKDSRISVKVLPSVYPQGGEKVLVYHTTRRVVPEGKLPLDVGCVVMNSSTVAFLGRYFKTGKPLVERCITVDGGAVKKPQNVIAPIGVPLKEVFDFCGGFKCEPAKVLYGGPMMGISVPDLDVPVLKNTNAILAFSESEAIMPKTTACIRCGACVNVCPFGITPPAIAKAYKNADVDALKAAGAGLCMECGCCSYVCPAARPLVANNRLAKKLLADTAKKEVK